MQATGPVGVDQLEQVAVLARDLDDPTVMSGAWSWRLGSSARRSSASTSSEPTRVAFQRVSQRRARESCQRWAVRTCGLTWCLYARKYRAHRAERL